MLWYGALVHRPLIIPTRIGRGDGCSRSFSDYLDHDLPGPRVVQFDEEDALVTPELHYPIDHGDRLAGSKQEMLQVLLEKEQKEQVPLQLAQEDK